MSRFDNAMRALGLVLTLTMLSGCAEYFERRDALSPAGGDAVATNEMTQMVDPWPRVSAERNIGFNGERIENAVQRYRTNRTYPPSTEGTSASYAPSQAANNTTPVGPTVTAPAAPVK
jgi:hypothetical protein